MKTTLRPTALMTGYKIPETSPGTSRRAVKASDGELQSDSEGGIDVPFEGGGKDVGWDNDGDELGGGEGICIGERGGEIDRLEGGCPSCVYDTRGAGKSLEYAMCALARYSW